MHIGRASKFLSKTSNFLLFIGLITFFTQPFKTGFEKGHHGWVSSHTLAIISRATPENYFLGYTRDQVTEKGPDKEYFDRYPVIFSGVFNVLLSPFWDHLAPYVYVSRQLMNLLFIISGWLILRIMRRLTSNLLAAEATLLILSSAFLVRYKDMVHFDQPAIVGCLLALNGILDFEFEGKKKFLLWGALFGTLLGRGYAVIAFYFAWVLVRAVRNRKVIRDYSLKILMISLPLPALMLLINIASEAHVRNVSIEETSIVVSAKHRLGLKSYVEKSGEEKAFRWGSFLNNQVQRAFDSGTPYVLQGIHIKDYKAKLRHYLTMLPKAIFQLFLLYLIVKFGKFFWREKNIPQKNVIFTFVLSGVLWIGLMRNLANYHEYVSLYLIGTIIVLYWFLITLIQERCTKLITVIPLIFIFSLGLNFFREQAVASEVNWQSSSFQDVRKQMKDSGAEVAYIGPDFYKFFEGVPHCADFMLSGFKLTTQKELADVVIVRPDERSLKLEKLR